MQDHSHRLELSDVKSVRCYVLLDMTDQGESNNNQDELYICRYKMMMDEWRREWHAGTGGGTDPNFPVQINTVHC